MSTAIHPADLTEHDLLVLAMQRDPADDLPRLAYADWLEDREPYSPRAEFIRVQCELARAEAALLPAGDPCVCTSERHGAPYYATGEYCAACKRRNEPIRRLRDREQELWEIWPDPPGRAWTVATDRTPQITSPALIVRRGWVVEVRAPLAVLFGGRCVAGCTPYEGLHRQLTVSFQTDPPCPACSGSGIVEGVAAAVGRAHPLVERAASLGAEPYHNGGGYAWFDITTRPYPPGLSAVPGSAILPHEVFRHLKGESRRGGTRWKAFATVPDAHAAHSDATVAAIYELAAAS